MQVGEDGIIQLAHSPCAQQLTRLNFMGCISLTDTALSRLADRRPGGLREVNLSACIDISDEAIMDFLAKCGASLTSFSLAGCVYVNDPTLFKISQCCSSALERCSFVEVGDSCN